MAARFDNDSERLVFALDCSGEEEPWKTRSAGIVRDFSSSSSSMYGRREGKGRRHGGGLVSDAEGFRSPARPAEEEGVSGRRWHVADTRCVLDLFRPLPGGLDLRASSIYVSFRRFLFLAMRVAAWLS